MMKLVCIKSFGEYEVGKHYEYWINFGGLNHIVKDYDGGTYPFYGPLEIEELILISIVEDSYKRSTRPYIFDYFQSIDEYRDNQLDKIL